MAAIGEAVQVMMGGRFSNGPAKGVYHGIVTEAAVGDTQKGGKKLSITVFGKDDPDHPEKEGKKLFTFSQTFPSESQDADTQDRMRGMWKRIIYDGFGLKWSTEPKPFDARQLVGKQAYFVVDEKKDQNGAPRNDVVGVYLEKDAIPVRANRATGTVTETKAAGRRR